MMDALISTFVDELKRRAAQYPDDLEGHMLDHGTEIDGTVRGGGGGVGGSSGVKFLGGLWW